MKIVDKLAKRKKLKKQIFKKLCLIMFNTLSSKLKKLNTIKYIVLKTNRNVER